MNMVDTMQFTEFCRITQHFFSEYFGSLASLQQQPDVAFTHDILFPRMMITYEYEDHFIAELTGLSRSFNGLARKKYRGGSVDQYFDPFREEGNATLFKVQEPANPQVKSGLQGICFSNTENLEDARERFPTIGLGKPSVFIGENRTLLSFQSDSQPLFVENCSFVSCSNGVFRCKEIMGAVIVSRKIKTNHLKSHYSDKLRPPVELGTYSCRFVTSTKDSHEVAIKLALQLQNLYLSPDIRETTIGEFFKLHPELIKQAFRTTHYVYEPYLKWMECDGSIEEEAINPDLMVLRNDGYYDIYDLKTAALGRRAITKASSSRRRFIDYVYEGVSQLGNYAEYFTFPGNAAFAKEKYGIQVKNPNLVLVVGSFENVNHDHVRQATLRSHKNCNIAIVDYDTLALSIIGNDRKQQNAENRSEVPT